MTVSTNQNQGIERTVALLKAIADHSDDGARLADIADETQLSRSTTHRLLSGLVQVGLVDQNPQTLRYQPGFLLYSLGKKAACRFGLLPAATRSLKELADETGDTVYLQIRSGDEAVCISRCEGDYPIKTLTLSVGDRRPLGIGAGSLALLSALPADECNSVITRIARQLTAFPQVTMQDIENYVEQTRCQNFAFNPGLYIHGMGAVGLAFVNNDGHLLGSLSIAAIASRMDEKRRLWLVERMRQKADKIIKRMADTENTSASDI
ncbi:IclR family transcriptional regulator [uncultured Bartonella sp.]|uniref:IclR family transcriptional regulator n=1 Tax=uncultured Bartonella sp. TaxID=104108 RepID=UPI002614CC02|nr:IclR family transcriptional regulator [uncultured Bartonella sp.]